MEAFSPTARTGVHYKVSRLRIGPMRYLIDGVPDKFEFSLLDADVDHFEPLLAQSLERVPALENAGIKQFINGPESFTPDGNFILGEAPELRGFFVLEG